MLRRLAVIAAFAFGAVPAATASAEPAWLPPVDAGTAGANSGPAGIRTAVSPGGAAVIAWEENPSTYGFGCPRRIRAMYRPAGGQFEPPATLSATISCGGGEEPSVAINDAGKAVVAFSQGTDSDSKIVYRVHDVTGGWGTPQTPAAQVNGQAHEPQVSLRGERLALGWNGFVSGGGYQTWGAKGTLADVPTAIPLDFETTGMFFSSPIPAIDSAGNAVLVWSGTGSSQSVRFKRWPAGGGPDGSLHVYQAGLGSTISSANNPRVASDAAGHVRLTFNVTTTGGASGLKNLTCDLPSCSFTSHEGIVAGTSGAFLGSVAMLPDASALVGYTSGAGEPFAGLEPNGQLMFATSTRLNTGTVNAAPVIATGPGGDAVTAYTASSRTLNASVRSPAGVWTRFPLANWIGGGSAMVDARSGIDDQGNALVAFGGHDCSSGTCVDVVRYRVFDAAAPALDSVSIPGSAATGTPASFSASASDRASAVTYAWDFGDGGSATGAAVDHTYGSPGSYPVTVTATDEAGNASSSSGTVVVSGAPGGPGGGGGGVKPAQVSAAASGSWKVFNGFTIVKKLGVKTIPAGATIYVKCSGGKKLGCPLKKAKKFNIKKDTKTKDLTSLFKPHRKAAKLRPKAKVEVGISAPGLLGRFTTWTFQGKKKKPKATKGCLAVGTTKHTTC